MTEHPTNLLLFDFPLQVPEAVSDSPGVHKDMFQNGPLLAPCRLQLETFSSYDVLPMVTIISENLYTF